MKQYVYNENNRLRNNMIYSLKRSGKIIKVEVMEAVEIVEVTEKQLIKSQTKYTQHIYKHQASSESVAVLLNIDKHL